MNRTQAAPRPRPAPARPSEAGYSLVEVLAAAFLLLGVLLAIMTMFIAGGQQINSGKLMTTAVATSEDILEEFRRLGHRQAYQLLNDGGDPTADAKYTWTSDGWTAGTDPPTNADYTARLSEWKRRVEGGDVDGDPATPDDIVTGLPNGSITITVRGLAELGAEPDEEVFADARIIQVMVTVRWRERRRERSVVFETLKV